MNGWGKRSTRQRATILKRLVPCWSESRRSNDYRHKEFVHKAKTATEKIEMLAQREVGSAEEIIDRAKKAHEVEDHGTVISLLAEMPEKLLDDDAKAILSKARTFQSELTRLEIDTKDAIGKKNWLMAGPLLGQLLSLIPKNKDYLRLAEGVSKKLMSKGRKYSDAHQYDEALQMLDSVPEIAQSDAYRKLRTRVENLNWLSEQFPGEPFATPMLGRLAVRWTKDDDDNPDAKNWVERLSKELRESPREKGHLFPALLSEPKSWCGGSVGYLGSPTCVSGLDRNELRGSGGRINIALGLALQGLGLGRVTECFAPLKQGVFGSFKDRKKKTVWGIDIGSSGIRAVCLTMDEELNPALIDCYIDEFEVPLCRKGSAQDELETVGRSIGRFLEQKDVSQSKVWANMPASQLISRFVRMPPLADKKLKSHMESEIKQRIPIATEELAAVRWVAPLTDGTVHGRPAVIVAARQKAVEDRSDLLKSLGLEVNGLQGDALALVNFADCEFPDLLTPETDIETQSENDSVEDEKDDVESAENGEDSNENRNALVRSKTPTIAIVDAGAQKTTLVLVSSEAHWFWTIEHGGEDITSRLSKSVKKTHDEAEKLKRNVADLAHPVTDYELVERRLEEIRGRLITLLKDALDQNKRFRVDQTWCCGGGALAHQYIRKVMLAE